MTSLSGPLFGHDVQGHKCLCKRNSSIYTTTRFSLTCSTFLKILNVFQTLYINLVHRNWIYLYFHICYSMCGPDSVVKYLWSWTQQLSQAPAAYMRLVYLIFKRYGFCFSCVFLQHKRLLPALCLELSLTDICDLLTSNRIEYERWHSFEGLPRSLSISRGEISITKELRFEALLHNSYLHIPFLFASLYI